MGDVAVQRGVVDVAAGGTTQAPPSDFGAMTSTIVWNSNNRFQTAGPDGSTSNQSANDMTGGVELTAVDTLTFHKVAASNSGRMAWESWEYLGGVGGEHEFIVRGRVAITLSGTTGTAAVSGVSNVDDCVPIITGVTSTATANDAHTGSAIAYMSDASTVTVVGQPDAATVTIYVTIVEFTGSAWSIKHGRGTVSGDSGNITLRDDADGQTAGGGVVSDWDNAIITGGHQAGDTTNVALADHSPRFNPGTSTTVGWVFDGNHDGTGDVFVHVIENAKLTVTRFTDGQTANGATNLSVAAAGLTDLSAASVFVTRSSSGTGTAYGRGWVNARLTSLTNVELYCHRSGNTINTVVQVADLANLAVIAITDVDGDDQFLATSTNVVLSGFGFEALQGTGKLELWDDTAGTTKVLQTIDSWADDSIQFDVAMGAIGDDATRYLVVTNDNGDVSAVYAVYVGIPPLDDYQTVIGNLNPDHWWRLNNDAYIDSGSPGGSPMTQSIQGDGGSFETVPICELNTHSWLADNNAVREAPDNNEMNLQAETERTMCGWIRVNQVSQPLTCIYKEGGSVNNVCFFLGMGNILIAQLADTSDDNVQAYSDIKLEPGRDYHITWRFSYSESPAEFRLYLDGKEQAATAGNPLLATDLDAHSGDIIWAGLDTNVEVAGTDVLFVDQESTYYAQWASWSIALDKVTAIRDLLFRRGARPEVTIASDTAANMQIALDALADTVRGNSPLAIRIEAPIVGIDLALDADNITFDSRITLHLEWRGGGTLTWTNLNGSDADAAKSFAPRSGTITIVNPALLSLTGLQDGSEVRVYEAGTETEVAGIESTSGGVFAASVQVASVDVVILALGFLNIRLLAIDTSGGDVTLPIQQRLDRQYENA